ncbi:MAG: nitroreductase family protein [Acidimicrobiia bacterium]
MELDGVMRTTGAARAFTDAPVDDATIYRVLERARFAPSGGNRQPWRVVVVKDAGQRRALRDLFVLGWREYVAFIEAGEVPFAPGPDGMPNRSPIDLAAARSKDRPSSFVDDLDRAPAMLVVGAHLPSLAVLDWGLDRQSIIGGASIYPFLQNLLLSARNEGLGGVMTTFLARQEEAARGVLGLPREIGIAAVVVLGVPEKFPTRLTRGPVEQFTTIDRFDGAAFGG